MFAQLWWKRPARYTVLPFRFYLNELLTPFASSAKQYEMDPLSAKSKVDATLKADTTSKVNTTSKLDTAMSKTEAKTNDKKVTKTIVTSPNIYKPVGPYSQAILANNSLLFVSGVLGMDDQAQLVCGGAEGETRQILDNLKHVLEAGGASLDSVIKTTIMLTNMNDFQAVNQVYAEYFPRDYPARATFQVAKLPKDACVEIEAIALSGDLVVAEAGPCPCSRV